MKRRLMIGISALAIVLLAVGGLSLRSGVDAQDGSADGHPLVGTWIADTDLEDATNAPEIFTFSSDGIFIQVDQVGDTLIGSWAATGESTGIVTIITTETDENDAYLAAFIIRGALEVSAAGDTFSGEYTFEVIDADGNSTGEAGPGMVEAEWFEPQAPGEPTMTIDELFTMLGGE